MGEDVSIGSVVGRTQLFRYPKATNGAGAMVSEQVRLNPQSGWPQVAASKGTRDCAACENFNNTSSPSPSPSHQGRRKGIGRTYAGPPPEAEALVTTKRGKVG
jgi:hypothetical protein